LFLFSFFISSSSQLKEDVIKEEDFILVWPDSLVVKDSALWISREDRRRLQFESILGCPFLKNNTYVEKDITYKIH